ncbi:shikimate kinase [Sinomicrobium sp.]
MVLVLIGYMGSGKSAVGRELAEKLSLKFVDLDDFIEEKEEKSISSIFSEKGEIYFRKAESRYMEILLTNAEDTVVALGGGTPCYGRNTDVLLELTANVFYLKASVGELVKRLSREKQHRPLLQRLSEEELEDFIRKHLFERNAYYLRAPHIVEVDGKTISEIVDDIASRIS